MADSMRSKRRFSSPSPEVARRLRQSKEHADSMKKRAIACPICGLHLVDAYGHEGIISAKCKKCKFDDPLDLALFRTMQKKKSPHFKSSRAHQNRIY